MDQTAARLEDWYSGVGTAALWLGHHVGPHLLGYWLPLLVCAALLILLALARLGGTTVREPYILLLLAGLVLAGRWPHLMTLELGPDESQALAGATLLSRDPVFFRSVDGTTHGPLLYYVLSVPHLFGVPLDYGLARGVAIACEIGALLLTYLSVRRIVGPVPALLSTVPAALLLAVTGDHELVAYSSECVPNLLLSFGVWLLCVRCKGWAFCLGVTLGALPFAKLQVVPVGALLGLVGLWLARRSAVSAGSLVVGTLLVPGLAAASLWTAGAFLDFWRSYLGSNVAYTRSVRLVEDYFSETGEFDNYTIKGWFSPTFTQRLQYTVWQLIQVPGLRWLLLLPLALALARLPWRRSRQLALALAYYAVTLLVTILPGTGYTHYFRFMIFPSVWLSALVLEPGPRLAGLVWLGLATLPLLGDLAHNPAGRHRQLAASLLRQAQAWPNIGMHRYSRELLKFASPGQRVAVWGWLPYLWVETGTIPATRDVISERQLEPRFDWSYFRSRYMSDLQVDPPVVIVDAVGSWVYKDRERFGLETFPELAAYAAAHYRLVAEVHRVRYWVRVSGDQSKDRR